MATYGERLPLAIDDLSDTEDVELGDSPPVVPSATPPPFSPLTSGGYAGLSGPGAGTASLPGRHQTSGVGGLGGRPALDDWADPATFGTTAPLTARTPPTPPAQANGARTPEVAGKGKLQLWASEDIWEGCLAGCNSVFVGV